MGADELVVRALPRMAAGMGTVVPPTARITPMGTVSTSGLIQELKPVLNQTSRPGDGQSG